MRYGQKCLVPLDDQCPAVEDIRSRALQTGVAHQVGRLEHVSVQPQVPLT